MDARRDQNQTPGGEFDRVMLRAIESPEFLFGSIRRAQVPLLVTEIMQALDKVYPSGGDAPPISDAVISLVERCRDLLSSADKSSPSCPLAIRHVSDDARDLLQYLAEQHQEVRQLINSESITDSVHAEIVDICTRSICGHADVHDQELIRLLLGAQENCLVSEEEKRDPQREVRSGLFSPITPEKFVEVITAPEAQILICKNACTPYGLSIYHGRGSCAAEDQEFVSRAHAALTAESSQREIESVFGVPYDPELAATVYSVFIDPDIKADVEQGGANTSRALVYDALIYYMLHELAVDQKRPDWVLAWVRTYPNPNGAERAHERVMFHDTGLELPFESDKPDGLRLKLLLLHIPTLFDENGVSTLVSGANQTRPDSPYQQATAPHLRRMMSSTHTVKLTDFDSA